MVSAGARRTASTTSTRPSTGTMTSRLMCKLQTNYLEEFSWNLHFRGSFPRTDSGKVTIEDIRDSNLLTFTPEEAFLSSKEDFFYGSFPISMAFCDLHDIDI